MTRNTKKEPWLIYADVQIATARSTLRAFVQKLGKDPVQAFEWSLEAFDAAARLDTWKRVFNQLAEGITLENIVAGLSNHVLSGIKSFPRSSNPPANLMGQCKLRADGIVLEELQAALNKGGHNPP